MNITNKHKAQLFLLFLLINAVAFLITEKNKEYKIGAILSGSLKTLNTHYEVLLAAQRIDAKGIYKTTIIIPKVLEIIKEANTATRVEKSKLRDELHNVLKVKYSIAKEQGILQYQFVLPNNESFYRAHKVNKFGDDLTNVRLDFEYTNRTHKPIQVFSQGRTAHAFRNIFPLFDKDNTYIGALEVSFSSERLQWFLNNISHIHTHFIVDKKIFDAKTWQRDDMVLSYIQSAESKDYMLTLEDIHTKEICIIENKKKLEPIRKEIDYKISLGKKFSTYVKHQGHIDVMTFIPIQNINKKNVAWIVSFEKSKIIYAALQSTLITRIVSFLFSLLIIYFLIKQIQSKTTLQNHNKLLNNILNETDNIMFITDFKNIKYSNDKFKSLINIKNINEFNSEHHHNLLDIFVKADGYLHSDLLKNKENFISLVKRTPLKDRIVSILDKNFTVMTFKISIVKTVNEDYLVTLSDITKMKEYQLRTEKKAYIDGLTGVYNRNRFDEIIKNEIKHAKRYNNSFSIAMLDIDKFKNFNDKYGHLIGDEVLITLAQTVNTNIRETDTFARWGGEEFVVLFKNTSINIAENLSKKLKDKIEANEHPTAGKVTASFGVTEYKQDDTFESLFKRCDDAMYKAKENGRNRVEVL